jgi:hypothetical protein
MSGCVGVCCWVCSPAWPLRAACCWPAGRRSSTRATPAPGLTRGSRARRQHHAQKCRHCSHSVSVGAGTSTQPRTAPPLTHRKGAVHLHARSRSCSACVRAPPSPPPPGALPAAGPRSVLLAGGFEAACVARGGDVHPLGLHQEGQHERPVSCAMAAGDLCVPAPCCCCLLLCCSACRCGLAWRGVRCPLPCCGLLASAGTSSTRACCCSCHLPGSFLRTQ